MTLLHPTDLNAWHAWAVSRQRLRTIRHNLRRGKDQQPPQWTVHHRPGVGARRVMIAADSTSPSARASLLTVLPHLRSGVDVLAPAGLLSPEFVGPEWEHRQVDQPSDGVGPHTGVMLSGGDYLTAGAAAQHAAVERGVPHLVVQHGALTPFAPPLPPGSTLLAWSEHDADFWRSRRADVQTMSVGSQLLWQAAQEIPGKAEYSASGTERLVFLGQLHGAELPRRVTGGSATTFCRTHHALYRPHPSEVDVLSRAQHRLWQRRGIEFAPTDIPLKNLPNPVVAVFSTGVLEAAVRGRQSWVYCPHPPAWVEEFWERYGMQQYGGPPTPAPAQPVEEPAQRIAQIVEDAL